MFDQKWNQQVSRRTKKPLEHFSKRISVIRWERRATARVAPANRKEFLRDALNGHGYLSRLGNSHENARLCHLMEAEFMGLKPYTISQK
jgi:hypothetical protein